MNKIGSLESQLMDAFKEKEEKEVVTTAADAKNLIVRGERKTKNAKRQLK